MAEKRLVTIYPFAKDKNRQGIKESKTRGIDIPFSIVATKKDTGKGFCLSPDKESKQKIPDSKIKSKMVL